MSWPNPADYFAEIAAVLDRLEIKWALAGALAAARYRVDIRITTDVDVLITWDPRLPGTLRAEGWDVRQMADPGESPHLIRAQRGEQRVDLIVSNTDYQREALRRATSRVLTVEDVLVHKFIAGRPRDLDDIRSIREAGREVDWEYVLRWTKEFGVEERVRAVLGPAD